MIRILAWWGTNRAMSSALTFACSRLLVAESTVTRTALRKTSWPRIFIPAAEVRIEKRLQRPVDADIPTQQGGFAGDRFHDHSAGAVAEKEGVGAVRPVGYPGQGLRAR